VFLSTDVGGIGLNLQTGSLLINLDIPWNQAILEQRIARIYRLGQKRNISVINMVSTDTIEHRMLGLLSFKKGLAEGILDQGDNTIFMEESKFQVLMNTVEEIVNTEGDREHLNWEDEEEEKNPKSAQRGESTTAGTGPQQKELQFDPIFPGDDDIQPESLNVTKDDSSAELIKMGVNFFSKLADTLSNPEETQKLLSTIVQKDEKEGKTYLKIPVENEKVVENVLNLLAGLMGQMKK
jgi:hypothetical protein